MNCSTPRWDFILSLRSCIRSCRCCSAGGAAKKRRARPFTFFRCLALALMLVPVFKLAEVSFLLWPFILLVDLLAIALAVLTATLLPVLAVLLLTLVAVGALILKIPSNLTGLPGSFFLLGAFIVFFVARQRLAGAQIQAGGRLRPGSN